MILVLLAPLCYTRVAADEKIVQIEYRFNFHLLLKRGSIVIWNPIKNTYVMQSHPNLQLKCSVTNILTKAISNS